MNTYKHATTMLILGLFVSLNTIACSDENNATQNTTDDMDPTTVQGDMDGTSTTDSGGTDEPDLETYDPFDDCPVAARPMYVIDADGFKLLSFDPPTLSFQEVGSVANCPSTVPDATPFSMSVDRNADAWVLYNSGELFIYECESGVEKRQLKKHEGLGKIEFPQTTQPKETSCFFKLPLMTGNSNSFLCFVGLTMASNFADGLGFANVFPTIPSLILRMLKS